MLSPQTILLPMSVAWETSGNVRTYTGKMRRAGHNNFGDAYHTEKADLRTKSVKVILCLISPCPGSVLTRGKLLGDFLSNSPSRMILAA